MATGSPFPGMDPYLEQFWSDVHPRLITYACDQLQGNLPSQFTARMEERIFLESDIPGESRHVIPDLSITQDEDSAGLPAAAGGVAVAEPILVQLKDEPVRQRYIEIIHAGDTGRIVTVIEFISPSNKRPGPAQALYLKKRYDLWKAQVSTVEIDLIRQGESLFGDFELDSLPPEPATHYVACAHRGWTLMAAEIYRLPLRQRLPAIRIPLQQEMPDVPLDLQALVDQCYRNGRYDRTNYQRPLHPPLDARDAAWAQSLLNAHKAQ